MMKGQETVGWNNFCSEPRPCRNFVNCCHNNISTNIQKQRKSKYPNTSARQNSMSDL